MSRPRISVFIAHSVDGYIATDDDSLDWLMAYDGIGEDYGTSPSCRTASGPCTSSPRSP